MIENSSYINLSSNIKVRAEEFIASIFSLIENQYDKEIINPKDHNDILLLIADCFNKIKDKEKWEKVGYDICKAIKQDLESYGVEENDTYMFGGFGYCCFAVSMYSKSTGNLYKFSKSLNSSLLEFSASKAKYFIESKIETVMIDYDVIQGLSGNLYYLLDYEWCEKEKVLIEYIIKYLITLTKYKSYNGNSVINFHITSDNQFRDDEKEEFIDGNLNFGISHGMMGPLIVLSKAYKLGYIIDGLEESIKKIYHIYEYFKVYKGDIAFWPSQLPLKSYLKGQCSDEYLHVASSWCYGNISISRGLYKVAQNMEWNSKINLNKNDLINIMNQEISKFNLHSPSLCHGFSSILTLKIFSYIDEEDEKYLCNVEELISKTLEVYEYNNTILKGDSEKITENNRYLEGSIDDLSLLEGSLGIALTMQGVLNKNVTYGKLLLVD